MVLPDRPMFRASAEEQKLPADELAAQANRLLDEFRQALHQLPPFLQAGGQYLLDTPRQTEPSIIRFTTSGIPYEFCIWPDDKKDWRTLVVSKGEVGGERIHLQFHREGYGTSEPWSMIDYRMGEGEEAVPYTNSREAVKKIEAFLEELKQAS